MKSIESVLIIEDIPEVADWLVDRVEDALEAGRVRVAFNLAAAVEALQLDVYQLVLIDLGLPDGDGTTLISGIKAGRPETLCVVTTIFDDASHLFAALRAGADGYLLKDESDQDFCAQLKGILAGRPPLSPSIARQILQQFQPLEGEAQNRLTSREQEILVLVAKGLSVRHAAEKLGITYHTAASYLKIIYQKLEVNCRAEATVKAINLGLINRL
ncbi:response regulator transcription factor [uncultured Halopseudomonas sp.]|uniref:response regulator transcription factor n=1 Tax=uncultured Halopseudomonas sp. TaxID=2901193 RepID=UPI0030EE0D35|tara:strand:+ start:8818 stop:9462 length:645 start_codon:yes stop_codon:yes gene_type:complete